MPWLNGMVNYNGVPAALSVKHGRGLAHVALGGGAKGGWVCAAPPAATQGGGALSWRDDAWPAGARRTPALCRQGGRQAEAGAFTELRVGRHHPSTRTV